MSKQAFGTDFIIVNDVVQLLDTKVFQNGPWLHLATVRRGVKEYMAFKKAGRTIAEGLAAQGDPVFIEEIDPHVVGLNKIKDDAEWEDVAGFLYHSKLLEFGLRKEMKIDSSLTA